MLEWKTLTQRLGGKRQVILQSCRYKDEALCKIQVAMKRFVYYEICLTARRIVLLPHAPVTPHTSLSHCGYVNHRIAYSMPVDIIPDVYFNQLLIIGLPVCHQLIFNAHSFFPDLPLQTVNSNTHSPFSQVLCFPLYDACFFNASFRVCFDTCVPAMHQAYRVPPIGCWFQPSNAWSSYAHLEPVRFTLYPKHNHISLLSLVSKPLPLSVF